MASGGLHVTGAARDESDTFDRAVQQVRGGADAGTEAACVYELLTDDERLGLLDGDMPWWQGLGLIRSEGYNRRPYVHGAVARLGIPGTRFIDGPRVEVFPVHRLAFSDGACDLDPRVFVRVFHGPSLLRAGPARVMMAISPSVYSRCKSNSTERSRTSGWQVLRMSCR